MAAQQFATVDPRSVSLVSQGNSSWVTRRVELDHSSVPDQGTWRVRERPKRGEYQPADRADFGPKTGPIQVHGKCQRALPGVLADLPGKRCVGSV